MPNNIPPLLPITVFICLSPFKIKILPQFFFLSDLVKTKLNLHVFKIVFKIRWIWCFQRTVESNLERAETSEHCFIGNQLNQNYFRLCNKWSSCPHIRLNKNKGLSLLSGGQYAQDRVGEGRKFSPLIFQWQGHLILKNEKVIEQYVAFSSR